jgi:hypothetical protein
MTHGGTEDEMYSAMNAETGTPNDVMAEEYSEEQQLLTEESELSSYLGEPTAMEAPGEVPGEAPSNAEDATLMERLMQEDSGYGGQPAVQEPEQQQAPAQPAPTAAQITASSQAYEANVQAEVQANQATAQTYYNEDDQFDQTLRDS